MIGNLSLLLTSHLFTSTCLNSGYDICLANQCLLQYVTDLYIMDCIGRERYSLLIPVENIGFGSLWLFVIAVYSTLWFGMSAYLFLNVAFGTIGHLGVGPFLGRIPIINYIARSSFHAQHHQDMNHNFGFYSIVWDRLFGTLRARLPQTIRQNTTRRNLV